MSNNIGKYFTSFDAPNYLTTFLIPFAVLSVIGYLIGIPFLISSIRSGGYNIVTYDSKCESAGKLACTSDDKDVYKDCVRSYTQANCDSTTSKTGIWAPILVYIILPAIVASAIAFGIYKLIIFVKNPRVAAGYFLARGVLHR